MRVHLLRHGIAEDHAASDAERALTPEGRKKLKQVLQVAAASGLEPSMIVSSPYKRAMQTAEIAAAEFKFKDKIVELGALVPDSTPRKAWDELRAFRDQPEVIVVGHEPLFSQLAAFLLGTPELMIDFKKGGILSIEMTQVGNAPRAALRWYLTPKLAGTGD